MPEMADPRALSMIRRFESLGYTLLYSFGTMDTLFMYQHVGDLVPIVIWEHRALDSCRSRNGTNWATIEQGAQPEDIAQWPLGREGCMYSHTYPAGIPYWKSLAFHFWGNSVTPWLGAEWSLAPEDGIATGSDNTFIGYSIEDRCMRESPYYSQREHRALIFAKRTSFFGKKDNLFAGLIAAAAAKVPKDGGRGFELVSTAGKKGEALDEPGVETLGRLSREAWIQTLARSKVLLGIGHPPLSPSPYDALCAGVPFINPLRYWDKEHPDDRTQWKAQQQALVWVDEPYVYHIQKGDEIGLARALREAAANPIDRYIRELARE
jgi:hypothetical protein